MTAANALYRLDRITDLHRLDPGTAARINARCHECGNPWPCATYRIATDPHVVAEGVQYGDHNTQHNHF